jgi:hypothetical protein
MVTCPNCGNRQEDSTKCVKCSTLFTYYTPAQLAQSDAVPGPTPVAKAAGPVASIPDLRGAGSVAHTSAAIPGAEPVPGVFAKVRAVYRAASWVALAVAIILFALIFHKSPPPPVAASPEAAHRAEEKIRASQEDDKLGVPHRLQLDGEELNSFLSQNLAINGRTQPGSSEAAPTAVAGSPAGSSAPTGSEAQASQTQLPHIDTGAAQPTLEDVQSAVKDVRVDLEGDLVKAYVVFNFHGADLSLELDGHLRAENGYLHFDPVSGTLGSLPLPTSTLQSAAEHLFDSPENREKMKLPNNVSGIQVSNGQLVFDYNDH